MEPFPSALHDSAEGVARSFLSALDEGRWNDAVALIDPEIREAFKRWWVDYLRREYSSPAQDVESETVFASPAELLGTADAAEAAARSAEALLAHFAEAVQPGNLHRSFRDRSQLTAGEQIRVTRRFLGSAPGESGRRIVRYHTEWWHGELLNKATAGVHELELVWTSEGWRVRDADLPGRGGGHILPLPME